MGSRGLEFRELKGLGGLLGLGIRASALGIVGFRDNSDRWYFSMGV